MSMTREKTYVTAEIFKAREDEPLEGFSQLSFQHLVENIADGILIVDLAGTVLYANPAAGEIFGQPIENLLHVPLGRPVVAGDIAEIRVRRPGTPPVDVEMRVVEIGWNGDLALLASLRDVSAQRAADERRRESQKMEAIGRLAAGIVHDFNNLLSVFESGLNLLEKHIAVDPTDTKVGMVIKELRARADNGGALTQQLLAFSRRQTLSPELIDVNARIESLIHLFEGTLGRGVEVRTDLAPQLDVVVIDANQFDVALLNLAVNARDAMDGSGTLTIATGNISSDGTGSSGIAAPFVCITVRDTGCGMSQEILAQVFEPFFTTKGEGRGTGLGLSQVYGFVNQSEGQVRIDSEPGKGTSVHLLLPSVADH
jgi:signal transduction histidine kinase